MRRVAGEEPACGLACENRFGDGRSRRKRCERTRKCCERQPSGRDLTNCARVRRNEPPVGWTVSSELRSRVVPEGDRRPVVERMRACRRGFDPVELEAELP